MKKISLFFQMILISLTVVVSPLLSGQDQSSNKIKKAFEETKKYGTKSKTQIVEIKKLVFQVQRKMNKIPTIDSKSTRKSTQPQAKTVSSKEKAAISGIPAYKTRTLEIPTIKVIKQSDDCSVYLDQLLVIMQSLLDYQNELKAIYNHIKEISDQRKDQGMTESEKTKLNEELSEAIRRAEQIKKDIDALTNTLDQIQAAHENCAARKPPSPEEIVAFENKMNKIKESYK